MELGQRLRQARLEAGLSQRQLCGGEITRNMLSQIENGTAKPSMSTLQYLANALGKPISYFLEEAPITSPNQILMQSAREAYQKGLHSRVAAILADYRKPDPIFDAEYGLLRLLNQLILAETALDENRLPYAEMLVSEIMKMAPETPYYTQELHRRLQLLRARVFPKEQEKILSALPPDACELFLRSKLYLSQGRYALCAGLLDAAPMPDSPQWNLLRGDAAMGLNQHAQAATYFHIAEPSAPQECFSRLEQCYREIEDYRMAYFYACKLREEK